MLTHRPSISLLAVKAEFWFTAYCKAPTFCVASSRPSRSSEQVPVDVIILHCRIGEEQLPLVWLFLPLQPSENEGQIGILTLAEAQLFRVKPIKPWTSSGASGSEVITYTFKGCRLSGSWVRPLLASRLLQVQLPGHGAAVPAQQASRNLHKGNTSLKEGWRITDSTAGPDPDSSPPTTAS